MPPPDLHLQSSCYRAQRPALWSGVTAILHGAESVALRRDADERSPIVALLQQHDRALVVSDYVCFKGRYWYEMRLSDGQTGWVPDGDKASEAWSLVCADGYAYRYRSLMLRGEGPGDAVGIARTIQDR